MVVVVTCCALFRVCGADRRQSEGEGESVTLWSKGRCGGAPRMRQQSLRPLSTSACSPRAWPRLAL